MLEPDEQRVGVQPNQGDLEPGTQPTKVRPYKCSFSEIFSLMFGGSYSVMQSDGDSLCGDVVLVNINMTSGLRQHLRQNI